MDLFSIMENSTCTVEGTLRNVEHNEEELIGYLSCEGNIVKVDCNYGHIQAESYRPISRERKSNRGRKKKPKYVKRRRYQGDGSGFNSQVSFTVLGSVIRHKPLTPDKHSLIAITIPESEDTPVMERFIKEYKIKVFRNGKFTVPGVLLEDLSDVMQPLIDLCKYLTELLIEDVGIASLFPVMRNYKFHMLHHRINIRNLQRYCSQHFQHLVNIQFQDVEEYIINFVAKYASGIAFVTGAKLPEIDSSDLSEVLFRTGRNKTLLVNFDELLDQIAELPLNDIAQRVGLIRGSDEMMKKITHYLLQSSFNEMQAVFEKSGNNILSHVKYDPEKYPGFLLKIKTPSFRDPDKKTTVKIFPSGKINIDGSNTREEAEMIYNWLHKVFIEHPQIYKPEIYSSSESSSSDME